MFSFAHTESKEKEWFLLLDLNSSSHEVIFDNLGHWETKPSFHPVKDSSEALWTLAAVPPLTLWRTPWRRPEHSLLSSLPLLLAATLVLFWTHTIAHNTTSQNIMDPAQWKCYLISYSKKRWQSSEDGRGGWPVSGCLLPSQDWLCHGISLAVPRRSCLVHTASRTFSCLFPSLQ